MSERPSKHGENYLPEHEMECDVCLRHQSLKNLPGGAVFADEAVFVAHFPLLSEEPAHFGHFILEMKRHLTTPAQLTKSEANAIGEWTQKVSAFLENDLKAEHTYVVRIGDKTKHLHFHFIPRFAQTPVEVWGPLLFRWAGSKKATKEDMISLTERFKRYLSGPSS